MHVGLLLVTLVAQPSGAQQLIGDSVACERCRISTHVGVRLGTADGPGAIPAVPTGVTLDSRGRYWLTFFRFPPMVFDSTGEFIAEVGRVGSGPGEYRNAPFSVPAGDSVAVFDVNRVTVVGPDLRPVREIRTSGLRQVLNVHAITWPQNVVVNADGRGTDQVGLPVHMIDFSGEESRIRASVAVTERLLPNTPQYRLRRHLTASTAGRVWVLETYAYRMTRWDLAGRLQDHLLRSAEWGPEPDALYSYGSTDTPPSPLLAGIREDEQGHVWVLGRVAKESWSEIWAEARKRLPPAVRSGQTVAVPASLLPGEQDLYDTMIEVIDPVERVVITRLRFNGHGLRLLRDGRLAVYRETEAGVPYVEIVAIRVDGADADPVRAISLDGLIVFSRGKGRKEGVRSG